MKLKVRGYDPILIPPEAVVPMKGSFDGETPYVAKVVARCEQKSYIAGKLPVKLLCLEYLRDRIQGKYRSYSDPMAGIGISARIFGRGLGNVLKLNDFDESCRKVLRKNFNVEVEGEDILKLPRLFPADLIFLDFNDFTFKRAQEKYDLVLKRAFDASQRFLIINDCSLFYFRYGKTAYENYSKLLGTEIETTADYFLALQDWYMEKFGWSLIQVGYFRESAFLLLSRRLPENALTLKEFTYADVPPAMVQML